MDNLISVLVADDNIEYGKLLHTYLNNCGDMIVKGVAKDGLETIAMLKQHEPDVLILDLIMPNLDGIGVLERLADLQLMYKPVVIVLTAVGQDSFIQKAVQLGAEYYMVKPFDIDMLVKRIRQLFAEKHSENKPDIIMSRNEASLIYSNMTNRLETIVTALIRKMGIIPNIAGFHYLREAVILLVENPDMQVARSLYSIIAQRHNTTAVKINRAIRNAVENSSGKAGETAEESTLNQPGSKDSVNTKLIIFLAGKASSQLGIVKK